MTPTDKTKCPKCVGEGFVNVVRYEFWEGAKTQGFGGMSQDLIPIRCPVCSGTGDLATCPLTTEAARMILAMARDANGGFVSDGTGGDVNHYVPWHYYAKWSPCLTNAPSEFTFAKENRGGLINFLASPRVVQSLDVIFKPKG
jgi:hypothetical protein